MHNVKTPISLLHPMKYSNEPLLPYESLLDITIHPISVLLTLIKCLHLLNVCLSL